MIRLVNETINPIRKKSFLMKKEYLLKEQIRTKLRSHQYQNILELAYNLKHDKSWEEGEINSMILKKNEHRKEILLVMHNDTKIESFQRDQSITLNVIEGEIKFRTSKHLVHLYSGQFFTLSEKVKYTFHSIVESTILITIHNNQIPN